MSIARLFDFVAGQRIRSADMDAELNNLVSGVNNNEAALDTHKTSADHDARYYTKAETDSEINQAVVNAQQSKIIETATTFPPDPTEGQPVFLKDSKILHVYENNEWRATNRVEVVTAFPSTPYEGQPVFRSDTKTYYVYQNAQWQAVDQNSIPLTQKGQANGVASLDSSGIVPPAQLNAGQANGVATLDANVHVPLPQLYEALPAIPGSTVEAVRYNPSIAKSFVGSNFPNGVSFLKLSLARGGAYRVSGEFMMTASAVMTVRVLLGIPNNSAQFLLGLFTVSSPTANTYYPFNIDVTTIPPNAEITITIGHNLTVSTYSNALRNVVITHDIGYQNKVATPL